MKSLISCNADFIAERNVDCKTLAKNRFLMPNDLTSNSVNCACCLLLINFMNPIYSLTGRRLTLHRFSPFRTTVTLDHPTTQQKHLLVAFLQDQRRHEIPAITELRAQQAATAKLMANRRDATRRRDVQSRVRSDWSIAAAACMELVLVSTLREWQASCRISLALRNYGRVYIVSN